MNRRKNKWIPVWLTAIMFCILFAMQAFAVDYSLEYAGWGDDVKSGQIIAEWGRNDTSKESKTKYRLRLYKGNKSTPVGGWKACSGTTVDLTDKIYEKGTGSYFYEIYPEKGGTELTITSETLEIDSTMKKAIRTYKESLEAAEEERFQKGLAADGSKLPTGWTLRNGIWYYRQTDGTLLKSSWLDYNGKWYYLSASGQMLTGWQLINTKWYYFDESGALLVNTTTPDGSTVNENGEWVENGVPVTDDRKKTRKVDATSVTIIESFDVRITEKDMGDGNIYQVSMKNTAEAQLVSVEYSIPQEQWVLGQPVTITVTYSTFAGYAFADNTEFTCGKGTIVSKTGNDATTRTFVITYLPNLKLATPENFYMNSDYTIGWDYVPYADKYDVRVISEGSTVYSKKVAVPKLNIADYMDNNLLSVKVYAIPNTDKKSYIAKSSVAVIDENQFENGDCTLRNEGTITKNSDGSMTYKDDSDNLVKNQWVYLTGNWYHFNKYGKAENQGWYLDSTGYTYYFDEKHRMVTGKITLDGKQYNLNDGTRTDLPLGARY